MHPKKNMKLYCPREPCYRHLSWIIKWSACCNCSSVLQGSSSNDLKWLNVTELSWKNVFFWRNNTFIRRDLILNPQSQQWLQLLVGVEEKWNISWNRNTQVNYQYTASSVEVSWVLQGPKPRCPPYCDDPLACLVTSPLRETLALHFDWFLQRLHTIFSTQLLTYTTDFTHVSSLSQFHLGASLVSVPLFAIFLINESATPHLHLISLNWRTNTAL